MNSHTHTASAPAAISRLRILTRWRSASALNTGSSSSAPTFLMLTGYEQVRSIAAALAGDREAADRVELLLPETGVCKSRVPAAAPATQVGCCLPTTDDEPAVATSA